jgi:hypothetical protein
MPSIALKVIFHRVPSGSLLICFARSGIFNPDYALECREELQHVVVDRVM